VEAELKRVLAAARVAVGRQAEGEARAYERDRGLLDLEAVVAEQRADVDLEQRPAARSSCSRSQPSSRKKAVRSGCASSNP
jgi:hypothetical protein